MKLNGFLGQLQQKKLCAGIQLPSQTLLLFISYIAFRLIGMLLPGYMPTTASAGAIATEAIAGVIATEAIAGAIATTSTYLAIFLCKKFVAT